MADDLTKQIDLILKDVNEKIEKVVDISGLEEVRVSVLGKKGTLTEILKKTGTLPPDQRPAVGKAANITRQMIEKLLDQKRSLIESEQLTEKLQKEKIDITLPGKHPQRRGSRHIISETIDEIVSIFIPMGYSVAEGPEVELDYYNFTALNTPPGHPARSLHDTFYVDIYDGKMHEPLKVNAEVQDLDSRVEGEILLRTHTSPVQIRVMKKQKPPVYIVCPGKAYRRDVADPSHSPMFHQIEGLAVDNNITFGDLKGTLERFAKAVFGEDRQIRMRPHFFPFTEPSAEVDVSCIICGGSGCRVCGHTGWLEILGAGMVDPNVLEEVGYDPEEVSGFAFGMGVERIAMLKFGITDIRLFFENDMRFLEQL